MGEGTVSSALIPVVAQNPHAPFVAKSWQCTATARRTGERCQRSCIRGCRVCYVHGGASRAVKTAGLRRIAEEEGRQFAASRGITVGPATDVNQVLLSLLDEVISSKDYLADRLAELQKGQGDQSSEVALIQAHERAVDRSLRAAVSISKLKTEETVNQARTDELVNIAAAIKTAVGCAAVNLSEEQVSTVLDEFTRQISRLYPS